MKRLSARRVFQCSKGLPALAALTLLSPALATAPDSNLAERTRACTACHGELGRAGPDGYYPRLAGKPAGYLHNQLRHFAQGQRQYGLMARLVAPLTDEYLGEIARHFASLELPYPRPVPSGLDEATLQRGRALVQSGDASRQVPACQSCHGQRLTGVQPHVPGLLGLPRDYLNAQLGAWQTGQRRAREPDCMAQVVKRLAPGDIAAVAGWLSSQAVPADPHPAPRPERAAAPLRCGSAPELGGPTP